MLGQRVGFLDDVEGQALLEVSTLVSPGGGIRAAPRDCRRRGKRRAARQRRSCSICRRGGCHGARRERVGVSRGNAHGVLLLLLLLLLLLFAEREERKRDFRLSYVFFLVFRERVVERKRGERARAEKIHYLSPLVLLLSNRDQSKTLSSWRPRSLPQRWFLLLQAAAWPPLRASSSSAGGRPAPASHRHSPASRT